MKWEGRRIKEGKGKRREEEGRILTNLETD